MSAARATEDYVSVEPQADGSFAISVHVVVANGGVGDGTLPGPSRKWTPTRRDLRRLAREGRTPYDEALRRGQRALDAHRADAARSAELRAQIATLR